MNKEHYYTLSWDTTDKRGRKRHFTRHFTDEAKAVRKANEIDAKPGARRGKLRELECWDEGPVTHVSFIRFVM